MSSGVISKSTQEAVAVNEVDLSALFKRIGLRIIPFLFICYVFNYIDRVNVGFAKLQMLDDLGMSEAVYGLGAGIFFIGYIAFGVPSNLVLNKVGARRWIAAMMVTWGLFSTALLLVRSPMEFYALRFLTGAAEAGFFPGVVLYLTRWFPRSLQGRVVTAFMSAIPISGVIGSPFSGWILEHFATGQHGLAAWQWLFLLQGLPTVVLGLMAWFFLTDRVEEAAWLGDREKAALKRALAEDRKAEPATQADPFMRVLRSPVTWVLGAVYFCIQCGVYGISFWLPTIVVAGGHTDPVTVGLLTAVPYFAAVVFMLAMGVSADRRQERRWHLAASIVIGAVGMLAAALFAAHPVISLFGMSLAAMGALTGLPMFWPYTNNHVTAAEAAGGFALINSCGQMAGFLSPYIFGLIMDSTGNVVAGQWALGVVMLIGTLLVFAVPRRDLAPASEATQ